MQKAWFVHEIGQAFENRPTLRTHREMRQANVRSVSTYVCMLRFSVIYMRIHGKWVGSQDCIGAQRDRVGHFSCLLWKYVRLKVKKRNLPMTNQRKVSLRHAFYGRKWKFDRTAKITLRKSYGSLVPSKLMQFCQSDLWVIRMCRLVSHLSLSLSDMVVCIHKRSKTTISLWRFSTDTSSFQLVIVT